MSAQPSVELFPTAMEAVEYASAVFRDTPRLTRTADFPGLLANSVQPLEDFDIDEIEDEVLKVALNEAARELASEFGREEEDVAFVSPAETKSETEPLPISHQSVTLSDVEQKMLAYMQTNPNMGFNGIQLVNLVGGVENKSTHEISKQFLRKMRALSDDIPFQEHGKGGGFKMWFGEPRPELEAQRPSYMRKSRAKKQNRTSDNVPPKYLTVLPRDAGGVIDESVAADDNWEEESVCAQTDPESFFPEKGGSTRESKRICAACPVIQQCLNRALETDEGFGIWGGLSERERRKIARLQVKRVPELKINETLIAQYKKVSMKDGEQHIGLRFALARRKELAAAEEQAKQNADVTQIAS